MVRHTDTIPKFLCVRNWNDEMKTIMASNMAVDSEMEWKLLCEHRLMGYVAYSWDSATIAKSR